MDTQTERASHSLAMMLVVTRLRVSPARVLVVAATRRIGPRNVAPSYRRPTSCLRPVLQHERGALGSGEDRLAHSATYSGACCRSTYRLITDNGAPPHEMMQYERDQKTGFRETHRS